MYVCVCFSYCFQCVCTGCFSTDFDIVHYCICVCTMADPALRFGGRGKFSFRVEGCQHLWKIVGGLQNMLIASGGHDLVSPSWIRHSVCVCVFCFILFPVILPVFFYYYTQICQLISSSIREHCSGLKVETFFTIFQSQRILLFF